MLDNKLWEECVAFHGHSCVGLTIGYRAALCARELLGMTRAHDEENVCISENDACGVDAIQYILGCSVGKGSLLFHMTGKMAFSFYNRGTGRSVRLALDPPEGLSGDELFEFYHSCKNEEMFRISDTVLEAPERAGKFKSYRCEICGEPVAENWLRVQDGRHVCVDCMKKYKNRFDV